MHEKHEVTVAHRCHLLQRDDLGHTLMFKLLKSFPSAFLCKTLIRLLHPTAGFGHAGIQVSNASNGLSWLIWEPQHDS